MSPEKKQELVARCASNGGDLILFAAGPAPSVHRTLDALRTYLAESLDLIDKVFFLYHLESSVSTCMFGTFVLRLEIDIYLFVFVLYISWIASCM